MLRIRFGMADLGMVIVGEAPVIEIPASLEALHVPPRSVFMERWRAHALRHIPPSARAIVDLVRLYPDGIPDQVIPNDCTLPGEGAVWQAMRAYYDACLKGDVWHRVQARKATAAAEFADNLAAGGLKAAMNALGPAIRFDGETLEIEDGRPDRQVTLTGKGIRLSPSVFWQRPAFAEQGFDDRPVLVYPVDTTPGIPEQPNTDPLVGLLGRTRADVLRAVVGGAGTGEIARRLGVSPASVSEHATALRDAGLVATRRDGKRVRHMPTELGRRLLGPQKVA
ncbi:putative regulatory protein [Actinorhabdospora filicis]|uniref:Regulatory protein n=1 Tax=Actinorhabdospora filicis TaxID=1785913 RepID=A0A9W6STG8_9ACTN|nr:helix-turn-helix domain-containing protein [Actinorhabdospora filicis]GLZ82038.1 putative regulatory protein [Actinorhabdospora filicis]